MVDVASAMRKRLKKLNIDTNKIHKTKKATYKKISGMEGKIKVFDQKLSNKFDIKAREIIKQRLGTNVDDNPNMYGEDLIVLANDIPYGYIELQVYGKWTSDKFPFPSPFVYERKMKFCNTTLFICFNAFFDKMILFGRKTIHPKKYREKKYSREFIHYVPWNKALMVDTDKFNIDTIKDYYSCSYSDINIDNTVDDKVDDKVNDKVDDKS